MNRTKKMIAALCMATVLMAVVPAFMTNTSRVEDSVNQVFGIVPESATSYTFTDTLANKEMGSYHSFSVPTGATYVSVSMSFTGGSDWDLSVWDASNHRCGGWTSTESSTKDDIANGDYSGYSSNPEWVHVDPPTSFGTWKTAVYAYSGAGSYTITVDVTTPTADTTDPSVSITSPSNGATVSGTISITASASDNVGVSYCTASLDGGSATTDSSSPYSWSLDTTSLSDGSHTVTVYAYDAAGNSDYDTNSFTVANGGGGDPVQTTDTFTGTLTSKGDIDYYEITGVEEGLMSLSVSWSTSYDIDCYIMTSANYLSYLARGYTTSNPETCSYTISSAGTYYIGVRMYSSASSSYTATVTYYTGGGGGEDTTDPTISITSPSNGAEFDEDSVTVYWSGSDNVGIDHYTYRLDSGSTYTTTSTSHTFTGLSDASHTVTVYAYDAAGNSAYDTVSFTVDTYVPDTTDPTISITSPSNGATITTTSVTVYWSGSDNVGIDHYTYKLDSGSTYSTTSTSKTFTGLSETSHTVTVYAYDAAGNSDYDTVSFTVDLPDTTDPVVDISSPANGANLEVSDVTVSWSGSDDDSGIDYFAIRIDSGSYVNKGTSTSHSYTGLADGSHTVDVVAYDNAGNSASDSVSFDIDTSGGTGPIEHIFTDYISQKTGKTYSFNVPSGSTTMYVELVMPSGADYDLSLWDANDARTGGYTPSGITSQVNNIPNAAYSGWTSTPETITISAITTFGTWDLSVYSYSGSGTFTCTVTIEGPTGPDETDPDISINNPANDGTVTSSNVNVVWTGSDAGSGINYYAVSLDGGSAYSTTGTSYTFSSVADGSHYVRVTAYDNAGNSAYDQHSFTVDSSGGDTEYYAVIVGISDYKAINDLSYCDEDATDWYNHLISMGWSSSNIIVLGDGHSSNYPKWDGYATEANMKYYLNQMVSNADSDDVISFMTSGHGNGDGNGNSYLCAWDCGSGQDGEDGDFTDDELAAIIGNAVAAKIHVFIDHCYSGGMGPELMALGNNGNIYCTTTCTEDGYGYDDSQHQNGAWTYYFLEYAWIGHYGGSSTVSLEDIYDYAHAAYPHNGGDECMEFDGDTYNSFYLN